MSQSFTIPGTLPGLNEVVNASRANKYKAAKLKKEAEKLIVYSIKAAKIHPMADVSFIEFGWFEPNRKRDPDNIVSARKFIMDALQKAGIIETDGWRLFQAVDLLAPFNDLLQVDKKNPRIHVCIYGEIRKVLL